MNQINHNQALRYLMAQADGLLDDVKRRALDEHLRECEACRREAVRLAALQRDLQVAFHARWDAAPAPAQPLLTALPTPEPLLPRLGRAALNLLLLGLWIWLYRAIFAYLSIIFSREEFRTNQLLLLGVIFLIAMQFRRQQIRPKLDALPQVYAPGLALAIGGSIAYLLVERFLDINTLSATLFGLATYGLIGLWMSPRRWREGLPAALLLIGVLPFGEHLQTFVGYPMRVLTAMVVQDGLGALGIRSVSMDTILILESGLAQVDNPCSGVKSLWTGLLFLIAATWIERYPINLRWFGVGFLTAAMLLMANIARVSALVVVDQVLGWKFLTELIHVPLGVLAFAAVCALSLLLLRLQKPVQVHSSAFVDASSAAEPRLKGEAQRPIWLTPALAALFAALALLYQPYPQMVVAQAPSPWVFPPEMQAQAAPLSPELNEWVSQGGIAVAERWNFEYTPGDELLRGALMFITSATWRGQHAPERCFEVQGLKVESSQTVLWQSDFPVRLLLLSHGPLRASALYWLQTGERTTDDFAARIWADLTPAKQRWVLVTVVLDGVYPPEHPLVQSLAVALRAVVAANFSGGNP